MAQRESLKEYQDSVLNKMEQARQSTMGDTTLYFGFMCNNMNFLIDGFHVVETTNSSVIQPIPVAKPWAIGAANIKGEVYSITDFSLLIGGKRIKKGKFLVLSESIISGSALMIESLSNLYEKDKIGESKVDSVMATLPNWINGVHLIDNNKYYMIDAEKFVNDPKFSNLQSGDNT